MSSIASFCSFVFALLNAAMLLGVDTEHEYPNNSETGTCTLFYITHDRGTSHFSSGDENFSSGEENFSSPDEKF